MSKRQNVNVTTESLDLHELAANPPLYAEPLTGYKSKKNDLSIYESNADGAGIHPAKTVPVNKYHDTIRQYLGHVGVYRSNAVVTNKRARKRDIKLIPCAWAELDTKDVPALWAKSREEQVDLILARADELGLPRPSWITFSGGGFHVYWLFGSPVKRDQPGKELGGARFVEDINRGLQKAFGDFNADSVADATRKMRLPGTINAKNGEICYIIYRNDTDGNVRTIHPRELQRRVMPLISGYSREDVIAFKKRDEARTNSAEFNYKMMQQRLRGERRRTGSTNSETLAQRIVSGFYDGVCMDIERLKEHRFGSGKIPEGWRDLFVFLYACALAHVVQSDVWVDMLRSITRDWVDEGFWRRHILTPGAGVYGDYLQTLAKRIDEHIAGNWDVDDSDGKSKLYTPIYTYSRARLQQELQITAEEQEQVLDMLADARIRERRRSERRRRNKGCEPKENFIGRAHRLDAAVLALRDGLGWSRGATAEKLRISKRKVSNKLNQGRKRGKAWKVIEKVRQEGEAYVDELVGEIADKKTAANTNTQPTATPERTSRKRADAVAERSGTSTAAPAVRMSATGVAKVEREPVQIDFEGNMGEPASVAQALAWIDDWREAREVCIVIYILREVDKWSYTLLEDTFGTDENTLERVLDAVGKRVGYKSPYRCERCAFVMKHEVEAWFDPSGNHNYKELLGRYYDSDLHGDLNARVAA